MVAIAEQVETGTSKPSRILSTSSLRTIAVLAEGGMGRVELALHADGAFQRLYAVKRLRPVLRDDTGLRAMFVDEACLAGLVRHPNVVSVLDVGEDSDGPYLVMEYVEGISAATLLRWASTEHKLLPVSLCIEVVRQAAEGLHAAHETLDAQGQPLELVHRDVSPQNLLLGYDGVVRVTDFGIAKALGRGGSRTSTGILKGKVGYMSPEQLRFERLDRRSDLFSLGVVLYELLSGTRLYRDEDDTSAARRILHEPPPDIDERRRDVHPGVVELLFSLMAKDPERRPATARDIARRLEAVSMELVALGEEAFKLEDYLEQHFGERRSLARQERDAGVQRLLAIADVEAGADGRRRRRVAIWIAAGACALSVGVAAALGLVSTPSAPHDRRRAPEVASAPPAPRAAEAVAEDAAALPAPLTADNAAIEPSVGPSVERAASRPARSTRRARRARHGATAPEGATARRRPTWDWQ